MQPRCAAILPPKIIDIGCNGLGQNLVSGFLHIAVMHVATHCQSPRRPSYAHPKSQGLQYFISVRKRFAWIGICSVFKLVFKFIRQLSRYAHRCCSCYRKAEPKTRGMPIPNAALHTPGGIAFLRFKTLKNANCVGVYSLHIFKGQFLQKAVGSPPAKQRDPRR